MDKKQFYKNLPNLATSRLIIRKMRLNDPDDIFEYASEKEVAKYLRWNKHATIQVTKQYIVDVLKEYSEGADGPWVIVFKPEKKVLGAIHLIKYNQGHKLTEVGYVLSHKYWNRGIMTEALQCVITLCFEKLKFNRVQGMCKEENIGSARVMEKSGMKFEGILRDYQYEKDRFWNLKVYSILAKEYLARAPQPAA